MQNIIDGINYVLKLNSFMPLIVAIVAVAFVVIGAILTGNYKTGPKVFGYILGTIGALIMVAFVLERTYSLIIDLTTQKLTLVLFLEIIKQLSQIVLAITLIFTLVFKGTAIGSLFSTILIVSLIVFLFLTVVTILIDNNVIKIEAVKMLLSLIK